MRKQFFALLVIIIPFFCNSQNVNYVHKVIDTLTSPSFYGRGYVNKGDSLAANYIAQQISQTGARSFNNNFFQSYSFGINTYPGEMYLATDKVELIPGKDYIISSSSPGAKGSYKALWLNGSTFLTQTEIQKFEKKNLSNTVLIIDTSFKDMENNKLYTAKAIIHATTHNLAWDVSEGTKTNSFLYFDVSREKIPEACKKVKLDVESIYKTDYQTQNVVAYIPGKLYPDSFFVFVAHYDHLGQMGRETYFPGAHDNASGTAMLLDLAQYYSKPENASDYSIAFIFFSGEEAGLLGSKYYSEHPLFPLKNIKFLLNLDMESTGSEGIKVVNGSVLKDEFNTLVTLNEKEKLLKTVRPRGEAANSDHYWFYKKGVKSFYIYTLGNEWKEYHTPTDVSKGLPMTKYDELFKLVTGFIGQLSRK
jgi:aminopeptidase YwaD